MKDLRDLNAAMAEKEAEKKKYIEQANAKSNSIQGSIDSTMELLDGLKTDVANLNGELNEKRAAEAGLTEKTETDDQKIDINAVSTTETQSQTFHTLPSASSLLGLAKEYLKYLRQQFIKVWYFFS